MDSIDLGELSCVYGGVCQTRMNIIKLKYILMRVYNWTRVFMGDKRDIAWDQIIDSPKLGG